MRTHQDPTEASDQWKIASVERRYERERRIRMEAESIAERTTRRLYDLTQELERSNRELEDLYAAQRDFVAIAAHELQTPITPIAGFAATLLGRWNSLDEESKLRFVGSIDRQARRLQRLATSMLTMSRLEVGKLESRLQPIDLAGAVHRVVEEVTDEAHEVGSSFDPTLRVLADPDHLQHILANYLDNAFRYGAPRSRSKHAMLGRGSRSGCATVDPEFLRDSCPGCSTSSPRRLRARVERRVGPGSASTSSGASHDPKAARSGTSATSRSVRASACGCRDQATNEGGEPCIWVCSWWTTKKTSVF